jgi:hypothetical protein
MNNNIRAQIDEVQHMTVGALREKYRAVFGEESRSNHKQFLIRRIAWRLQELAEGGLSERARQRALEIANDADLRIRAPKGFLDEAKGERTVASKLHPSKDSRLPSIGTELTRKYKGQQIIVRILEDGFEYDGRRFRSLSAIATEVTGTRWNGFLFFGIDAGKEANRAKQ